MFNHRKSAWSINPSNYSSGARINRTRPASENIRQSPSSLKTSEKRSVRPDFFATHRLAFGSRNSASSYGTSETHRSSYRPLQQGNRLLKDRHCKNFKHDINDCIDDPNEYWGPGPGDDDFYKHPTLNGECGVDCVANVANVSRETVREAAIAYGELKQRGGMTLLGVYHTLMSLEKIRALFHTESYDWSSLPNKAIVPVSIQGEMRPIVYTKGIGPHDSSGNARNYQLLSNLGYIGIEPGILPPFPSNIRITRRRTSR